MLMCFQLFDKQRKKANIQLLLNVQSTHIRETKYDYLYQITHIFGVHYPNTISSKQCNTYIYRNAIKAAEGHNFIELKSCIR